MKKKSHLVILLLIASIGIFLTAKSTSALTTPNGLKGKILLQVESKGEAWYVSPADGKRYSMGRPNDAFNLIRQLGIGISNDNLKKIQTANENLTGLDSDSDGLSDMIENSIGTNKNNQDSDGDGFNDKDEIIKGYNPNGVGKIIIDNNFAKLQAGKIFLQVESRGEAWYINPIDYKRYFLGRPTDAFNLMRMLGLGISNTNLSLIPENFNYYTTQKEGPVLVNENAFPKTIGDYNFYKVDTTYGTVSSDGKSQIPGFGIIYTKKNNSQEQTAFIMGKADSRSVDEAKNNSKQYNNNGNLIFCYNEAEKPCFWITDKELDMITVYYTKNGEHKIILEDGSESEISVVDWLLKEFPIKK